MTLRHLARWITAALLVTLCAWAANRAAHMGWASFRSLEARALLWAWMERPGPIDQLDWNRAREGFVAALEWDPENPAYHEAFANLYMVRLAGGNRTLQRPYFQLALRHYLKAAALRPTWSYTHASIASMKQLLGELDGDFKQAIMLASQYGPWETAVHERLIVVGYRSWAVLGAPEREAIRGNLRRSHQYRPKQTVALLATLKAVAPLCSELRVDVPDACTVSARSASSAGGASREPR